MGKFKLLHPDTEILGQMVIDFEQAANSSAFVPILKKHGLDSVQADQWYSGQAWLNVLNEIHADSYNRFRSLISIGMKQIENVNWPPEFYEMTLEEVFLSINPIYQSHCRGTDVGEILIEKVSDKHFKIILRVFEPDDVWYGNIYQMVKTFDKTKRFFALRYDQDVLRRDHGGEITIIHIEFN